MSIEEQMAIGIRQAMDALGHEALYTRKDTDASVSLTAIPLESGYQCADEGSVIIVAADRWGALIVTADLAFDSSEYEPQPGDTLVMDETTYLVAIDEVRRYCWTWVDHHKLRRHIFLKRTL